MKRTVILAAAAMTMFGLCGKVFGSDPVQLRSPCNLFMLNPHTGAVLGIDAKAKAATLYPKNYIDGKNKTVIGPVEIAAGAQGVLFKKYKDKSYFLICFKDSTQIFILDAGTLKVAGKVTVKQVVDNTFTTSSDPDDPYVYCAGGFHEGGDYFSMKTRAWDGNTGVRGSDIAVSADGNYIYSRSTGVSPTGFDCYKKTVNSATGKPPKGIPVLVPVRVAATDKHQHVASLQYQAVIDLPKELLLKKIETMIAKVEKERREKEKLVAERERQWRQEQARRRAMYEASRRATTRPADPETTRKLEERIKELEQQVRELKTKVELLITLVKEKR